MSEKTGFTFSDLIKEAEEYKHAGSCFQTALEKEIFTDGRVMFELTSKELAQVKTAIKKKAVKEAMKDGKVLSTEKLLGSVSGGMLYFSRYVTVESRELAQLETASGQKIHIVAGYYLFLKDRFPKAQFYTCKNYDNVVIVSQKKTVGVVCTYNA